MTPLPDWKKAAETWTRRDATSLLVALAFASAANTDAQSAPSNGHARAFEELPPAPAMGVELHLP